MIDEIFEMVMKEARSRPGNDLVKKTYCVIAEVHTRLMEAMEEIRADERRDKKHENESRNP